MPKTLPNGQYTLVCLAQAKGTLGPALPKTDQTSSSSSSSSSPESLRLPIVSYSESGLPVAFDIKEEAPGEYVITLPDKQDASLVGHDKLLFAEFRKTPAERWLIEQQPQHGEHVYTVSTKNDRGQGWIVQDTDATEYRVVIDHLICTYSIPPKFPPSELFLIIPIPKMAE